MSRGQGGYHSHNPFESQGRGPGQNQRNPSLHTYQNFRQNSYRHPSTNQNYREEQTEDVDQSQHHPTHYPSYPEGPQQNVNLYSNHSGYQTGHQEYPSNIDPNTTTHSEYLHPHPEEDVPQTTNQFGEFSEDSSDQTWGQQQNQGIDVQDEAQSQPQENSQQQQQYYQHHGYEGSTSEYDTRPCHPQNVARQQEQREAISDIQQPGSGRGRHQDPTAEYWGNYEGSNAQYYYGASGTNRDNPLWYYPNQHQNPSELHQDLSSLKISGGRGHQSNPQRITAESEEQYRNSSYYQRRGYGGQYHPSYYNFNPHHPPYGQTRGRFQRPHNSHWNQRQPSTGPYNDPQSEYYPADDSYEEMPGYARSRIQIQHVSNDEDADSSDGGVVVTKPKKPKKPQSTPEGKGAARKPPNAKIKPAPVKKGPAKPVKKKKKISWVKTTKTLEPLGNMEELSPKRSTYKILAKYVKNSSDFDESMGEVKIHKIYKIDTGPETESNTIKQLLFFRTTPASVKRLLIREDGCVAFYDRLCRALPVRPAELTEPHRQMVLLFSVSLGTVLEDRSGYKIWSQKEIPKGFGSVKAVGKFIPSSKDIEEIDSIKVTCGKTVMLKRGGKSQKYELDYNEYIIYKRRKATVKYAIDVEIIPVVEKSEDESESE